MKFYNFLNTLGNQGFKAWILKWLFFSKNHDQPKNLVKAILGSFKQTQMKYFLWVLNLWLNELGDMSICNIESSDYLDYWYIIYSKTPQTCLVFKSVMNTNTTLLKINNYSVEMLSCWYVSTINYKFVLVTLRVVGLHLENQCKHCLHGQGSLVLGRIVELWKGINT